MNPKGTGEELEEVTAGTLRLKEPHPAARYALTWLGAQSLIDLSCWQESFSSCAIEGNRLAEVCAETLNRYMTGKPLSDRYLLGLCWMLRHEIKSNKKRRHKK